MTRQGWLGVALIVAGGVLALFLRDVEFLWFRGGPLGVVLVVVGVIDLAGSFRRSRRTAVGPDEGRMPRLARHATRT